MTTMREILEAKGGDFRALLERLEAQTKTGVTLRVLPGGLGAPEEAGVDFDLPAVRNALEPLQVGKTEERNGMRIHRWADSYTVTELVNAGKRGKQVRSFGFDVPYSMRRGPDPALQTEFYNLVEAIREAKSYDVALGIIRRAAAAAKGAQVTLHVYENTSRGVDVEPPAGSADSEIEIDTPHFNLTASMRGFSVTDKDDQNNLPCIMTPVRGAKGTAVKAFYRWVQANRDKIQGMTFRQLSSAVSDARIDSHYYCRMD